MFISIRTGGVKPAYKRFLRIRNGLFLSPDSYHPRREPFMSSVEIGLLMVLGISFFGFITLGIDLLRARRIKGK